MSKSIALLSGKGGSGKTSLALSMASLLSTCGLKVLLVDCDLSTNGATYFYEDQIGEKENLRSFFSYFFEQEEDKPLNVYEEKVHDNMSYSNKRYSEKRTYLKINDYTSFIPSILRISKSTAYYRYSQTDRYIMDSLDTEWRKNYDIVIYDCQAGYSNILKTILPFVDVNLLVMEPDVISSISIRSLYLKIGDYLNERKTYQVFNKASKEEYEKYSGITDGVFFTSIECVLFDWQIRKAFSEARIPELSNTSAHYGQQIFNICSVLFREEKMQKALSRFEDLIKLNDLIEQEKELNEKVEEIRAEKLKKRSVLLKRFYGVSIPIFLIFTFLVLYLGLSQGIYNEFFIIVLIAFYSLAFVAYFIFWLMDHSKNAKNKHLEEQAALRAIARNQFNQMEIKSIIEHKKEAADNSLAKEQNKK